MVEIDLGPGFGFISSHDIEERIAVSKPFSTVLEMEEGVGGGIAVVVLLISMRTGRSIYNSRLRIAIDDLNISRIARPASELRFQNTFHSIFVYDLSPIKDRLRDGVEINIESRDLEVVADGISLVAIYSPGIDSSSVESHNKVHIGPYILRGGERLYLKAKSYSGGDLMIRGIAIPSKRADIKLSLSLNKTVRRLSLGSSIELLLRLCGTTENGDDELELEGSCSDGECSVKIPWIFVGANSKRSPEYVIGDIKLSSEKQELLVELENIGDFDAREINIVVLWKGTVIGRAVERISRKGIARVPLSIKTLAGEKPSPNSPLIVRAIWRWMGVLEEREKIFKPGA